MMQQLLGCGLPNVYLRNGYEIASDEDGEWMAITDTDGLYEAIARAVATKTSLLTGSEVKFLRKRLKYSQGELGNLLGKTDQAVAKWEKGANVPASDDRSIRTHWLAANSPQDLTSVCLRKTYEAPSESSYEFAYAGGRWREVGTEGIQTLVLSTVDHTNTLIDRLSRVSALTVLRAERQVYTAPNVAPAAAPREERSV